MRRALSRLGMFLPLLVACGGDSTGPTMNTVAGSYAATTFTATDATGTTDLLAGGASIAATLNADGTTTGALHVPAALNNGTPIDEDLTGTWALDGTAVTFHQTGGTLLPALTFAVHGNQLEGSAAFSGTTLHVVLSK